MSQGPRVLRPERGQLRWEMVDLDSQLPPEHRARLVWSFVAGLDLADFYARIKARDDTAGRPDRAWPEFPLSAPAPDG